MHNSQEKKLPQTSDNKNSLASIFGPAISALGLGMIDV